MDTATRTHDQGKQNFIGLPFAGQGAGVNSSTSDAYGVSVNASWEIDLWGKLSANQAAALANLEASRALYRGARQSLAAQTAKAYFAAIEAKQQLELAQPEQPGVQLQALGCCDLLVRSPSSRLQRT